MTAEDQEQWDYVLNKMDNEGFHYCFKHYSDFSEVKDEKFHELRSEYLKCAELLGDYVKSKVQEEIDYDE